MTVCPVYSMILFANFSQPKSLDGGHEHSINRRDFRKVKTEHVISSLDRLSSFCHAVFSTFSDRSCEVIAWFSVMAERTNSEKFFRVHPKGYFWEPSPDWVTPSEHMIIRSPSFAVNLLKYSVCRLECTVFCSLSIVDSSRSSFSG